MDNTPTPTPAPTSPSSPRDNSGLGALLDFGFNKFITLSIIKILYVLYLVVIVLGWLGFTLATMFGQGILPGIGVFIVGSIVVLLYAILIRVGLELIVVVFRIGENTSKLVEMRGGA